MPNLVKELKGDHQKLVTVLTDIRTKGITTKEGLQLLMKAKADLLAHLKKEDTFLYPQMQKAAQTDTNLKQTLDLFGKDMSKITEQTLAFFDKYKNGGSGMEFAKDIGGLLSVLGNRIQREENVLYAEYNKIKGVKAA